MQIRSIDVHILCYTVSQKHKKIFAYVNWQYFDRIYFYEVFIPLDPLYGLLSVLCFYLVAYTGYRYGSMLQSCSYFHAEVNNWQICLQPFQALIGSRDSLIPLDPKVEREYDPLWPNEYEKVVKGTKFVLRLLLES